MRIPTSHSLGTVWKYRITQSPPKPWTPTASNCPKATSAKANSTFSSPPLPPQQKPPQHLAAPPRTSSRSPQPTGRSSSAKCRASPATRRRSPTSGTGRRRRRWCRSHSLAAPSPRSPRRPSTNTIRSRTRGSSGSTSPRLSGFTPITTSASPSPRWRKTRLWVRITR